MLRVITLRGEHGTLRTHVTLYTDIWIETRKKRFYYNLTQPSKKMQNNVETQHKYIYLLCTYIGSSCIVFPMARFTCIVTLQVFLKI